VRLHQTYEASTKVVQDRDAKIRQLSEALDKERTSINLATKKETELNLKINSFQALILDQQKKIAALEKSVKDLEDNEVNAGVYWGAVARIELLREPVETHDLQKEIESFRQLFPDQQYPGEDIDPVAQDASTSSAAQDAQPEDATVDVGVDPGSGAV